MKDVTGGSPMDGENQIHYSGNAEGSRDESVTMSAGVADGLSSMESMDTTNAESVTHYNQRPEGNSESAGGSFKIGVL